MDTTKHECCIHGYYIYKEIWDAAIGEELDCQQEPNNTTVCIAKFCMTKISRVKISPLQAHGKIGVNIVLAKISYYTAINFVAFKNQLLIKICPNINTYRINTIITS